MGRNDHKHGRHHKAAVVHAMEEQALTADQVVTLAAAGRLKAPNGHNLIPPFTIAASTCRNYVQFARRRERRAATNGGHDSDDGPVPNETVTVTKPKPAPERHRWGGEDLETSEILQRLLAAENDPRDTAPPPPPD